MFGPIGGQGKMFMKSITSSKVKFKEQQLDDYVLENSVLKSKLNSKTEALSIMSKELDKCSMERDRYRLLVQQLQIKHCTSIDNICNADNYKSSLSSVEILANTREQNALLKLEAETLRLKLAEAKLDIEALRKHLQNYGDVAPSINSCSITSKYEYEDLVKQLEKIKKKYQQLQLDYRATLDQKEEVIADRDYYKGKVARLNQQMSQFLSIKAKGDGETQSLAIDIDAVVMENKSLHEKIAQLQVENDVVKRTLSKYKSIVERRIKDTHLDFISGEFDAEFEDKVQLYLDGDKDDNTKKLSASDFRCLCSVLLASLADKSIALQHQRKTNRVLAERVSDLEKTLESWSNGEKYIPVFPSQMLLDEFCPQAPPDGTYHENNTNDGDVSSNSDRSDYTSCNGVSRVFYDSDDDKEITKSNSSGSVCASSKDGFGRTVLPPELENLVRAALSNIRDGRMDNELCRSTS